MSAKDADAELAAWLSKYRTQVAKNQQMQERVEKYRLKYQIELAVQQRLRELLEKSKSEYGQLKHVTEKMVAELQNWNRLIQETNSSEEKVASLLEESQNVAQEVYTLPDANDNHAVVNSTPRHVGAHVPPQDSLSSNYQDIFSAAAVAVSVQQPADDVQMDGQEAFAPSNKLMRTLKPHSSASKRPSGLPSGRKHHNDEDSVRTKRGGLTLLKNRLHSGRPFSARNKPEPQQPSPPHQHQAPPELLSPAADGSYDFGAFNLAIKSPPSAKKASPMRARQQEDQDASFMSQDESQHSFDVVHAAVPAITGDLIDLPLPEEDDEVHVMANESKTPSMLSLRSPTKQAWLEDGPDPLAGYSPEEKKNIVKHKLRTSMKGLNVVANSSMSTPSKNSDPVARSPASRMSPAKSSFTQNPLSPTRGSRVPTPARSTTPRSVSKNHAVSSRESTPSRLQQDPVRVPTASPARSNPKSPTSTNQMPDLKRADSLMSTQTEKEPSSKRLMEHFLVIGTRSRYPGHDPDSKDSKQRPKHIWHKHRDAQGQLNWTEEPEVLVKFPAHANIHSEDISSFAFPDGVRVREVAMTESMSGVHSVLYSQHKYRRGPNSHVFMVKTANLRASVHPQAFGGDAMYGICVTYDELYAVDDGEGPRTLTSPVCYVILSRYPFFQLHVDLIHAVLSVQQTERLRKLASKGALFMNDSKFQIGPHQIQDCVELIQSYYAALVPRRGQRITIAMPSCLAADIVFRRPRGKGDDVNLLLSNWCCVLAWSRLSAHDLIDVLECLLNEYKVIVVGENLALITAAVLSFVPLLRPLVWTGILLPVLPQKLIDFLESPVPILTGVHHLPPHLQSPQQVPPRTLVWFPGNAVLNEQREVERKRLEQEEEEAARKKKKSFFKRKKKKKSKKDNDGSDTEHLPKFWISGSDQQISVTESLATLSLDTLQDDVEVRLPHRQHLISAIEPILAVLHDAVNDPDAKPEVLYYPDEPQMKAVQDILALVHAHMRPLLKQIVDVGVAKTQSFGAMHSRFDPERPDTAPSMVFDEEDAGHPIVSTKMGSAEFKQQQRFVKMLSATQMASNLIQAKLPSQSSYISSPKRS